jgi:hypothetical protein
MRSRKKCCHTPWRVNAFIVISMVLNSLVLNAHAQEATVTAGGEATGAGGTVSFTAGQVFYQGNAHVNEGVQQPYEIFTVSSGDLQPAGHFSLSVYPNPASDIIYLRADKVENTTSFTYHLYDLSGRHIMDNPISDITTPVNMHFLHPGVYFLKVFRDYTEIQTFKIIKNK